MTEAPPPESALGQITVTGTRHVDQIEAGPLGSRSILETPFSVGRTDAKQITRIAATTIDAAFNYDASIRSANSGVASGNYFTVRGQLVDRTFGYKYDGLAFPYWFQDHPVEALSEIQILKGAGGFVYGYAPPSGVVNFVSKRPTETFQASANLSLRSANIVRAHVDVGGPFREGGSTAFRFNAVHEEGRLYNGAYNRNQFVSLWLQGKITPKLTWSTDGFYQRTWQAEQSNSISVTQAVTELKPVSGKLNLAAPADTKLNDISLLTGRLNYQISPNWRATAAVRYSMLDERFPAHGVQIFNNAGDYRLTLSNVQRLFFYYVGQATVDGKFNTGPLEHAVVGGFDYFDVNFDDDYRPPTTSGTPYYALNLVGNIYDPPGRTPDWGNIPLAVEYESAPNWFRYQEIRQRGVYVSDTVKLGGAELLLGLRYTIYKETNNEPELPDTKYNEKPITPVAALSYQFIEGARVYASYVQALQRGGTAPLDSLNFGETFGPLKSNQYEAGVKAQRRNWGATLAVYRTTVPSEFLAPPAPGEELGRFVRDGERRFQGIEFDGHFEPSEEWLLNFSTTYLDAEQTKAATPALVGKKVPGATDFQASGFVQYEPSYLPGFSLFGGVRHSGKAYGQALNTFKFSPNTQGDVGVGYVKEIATNELQLQANVRNVTDEQYWLPRTDGAGLSAGPPRTYSVSIGLTTGGRGSSADHDAASEPARVPGAEHWYLGLGAGVAQFTATTFDVRARAHPNLGRVNNALIVKHRTGWEIDGAIGYDLGLFRAEFEATHGKATLKRVTLRSDQIPIEASNRPAGIYDNPGGSTKLTTFLFNGLFDVGGDASTPWALQAGAGIGLARHNTRPRWKLEDSAPSNAVTDFGDARRDTEFQGDIALNFAWQVLAAVRRRLTDDIDLTLKYRLVNLPNLTLFTANANEIEGSVQSHSVVLGTAVNF